MNKNFIKTTAAVAIVVMTATGCADMTGTQRGTATGAGIGAGLAGLAGTTGSVVA